MKTKKMKLQLKKNTVANLNNGEMRRLNGGIAIGTDGIELPPCTGDCPTDGCNPTNTCNCPSIPAYITCIPEQCPTDFC